MLLDERKVTVVCFPSLVDPSITTVSRAAPGCGGCLPGVKVTGQGVAKGLKMGQSNGAPNVNRFCRTQQNSTSVTTQSRLCQKSKGEIDKWRH